jgi:hypothetical protein
VTEDYRQSTVTVNARANSPNNSGIDYRGMLDGGLRHVSYVMDVDIFAEIQAGRNLTTCRVRFLCRILVVMITDNGASYKHPTRQWATA